MATLGGKRKKITVVVVRLFLSAALFLAITAPLGMLIYHYHNQIPTNLYFWAEEEQKIDFGLPATGMVRTTSSGPKSNIPKGAVFVDLSGPVTMRTGRQDEYDMEVKLFGILPLKKVNIHVIENRQLIPMGTPVGIYMKSKGVLVIGVAEFETETGEMVSPAKNVLKSGDYIVEVNGKPVKDKEELMKDISDCDGKGVLFTVEREGETEEKLVIPKRTITGEYKAGIWVRDNVQGVGTLTYLDANGRFGALGHGITDVDTGTVFEVDKGILYQTQIVNLRKGEDGRPGEMTGRIIYEDQFILGEIEKNNNKGIFGKYHDKIAEQVTQEALPIGFKQEIECGPAQILCTIDENPKTYQVEITKLHLDHDNVNRGIELKVTDPELLSDTGGIIQGMSGSPILQNGKIIGAVTHVLVNSADRGYGIFIENMLSETE